MTGIMLKDGTMIEGKVGRDGNMLMLEIPTTAFTNAVKTKLQNPALTSEITYYYGIFKNVFKGYTSYSYNAEDDDPYDGVSIVWMTNASTERSMGTDTDETGATVPRAYVVDKETGTHVSVGDEMRVYIGPSESATMPNSRTKPRDCVITDPTIGEHTQA